MIFKMINFVCAALFSSFLGLDAVAQQHVAWEFTYDNQASELVASATIDEGWHLYSQRITNDFGPIPTSFEFSTSDTYTLIGKTQEPEPIKQFDPNFEGEMHFFEDEVTFRQQIQASQPTTVEGTVTFMVCNDSMCMPPVDVPFKIKLNNENE